MFPFQIRTNVWWQATAAHTHCQWHFSGHSPKPRLQLLLYLIWGWSQDLQVRALTAGLLSGFSVLNFSLFPLPSNGKYAKKDDHIYLQFLNSFHGHLILTWQKTESLVWGNRVRSMCSTFSSSSFSLSPTPLREVFPRHSFNRADTFFKKVSFSTKQHFALLPMTGRFSNSALVRTFSETGRSLPSYFAGHANKGSLTVCANPWS